MIIYQHAIQRETEPCVIDALSQPEDVDVVGAGNGSFHHGALPEPERIPFAIAGKI
ncbi:MAG: hypothetical protein LC676_14410 [Loktanella sp.]|nr:hypothetical protein [Loktanella sp.]